MMDAKLVGSSTSLREIALEVDCAARSDAKVLITGESGVGKDIVARLIHQSSRRVAGPFVTINCAGVPDTLLESELFGHVRGSFTDAYRDKRGWLDQAQGGTAFLDEVGEMSARMQALLLRFLENGEIQRVGSDRMQKAANVRVIAATNRNLVARVADGGFREDLYYRLNVIHIAVSPLRLRMEDVPPLLSHFLKVFSAQQGVPEPAVSPEAMTQLMAYTWPGNVRELKNVVERLVVRSRSAVISPSDLPREFSAILPVAAPEAARVNVADLLYERICVGGDSFWSAVYDPFMSRDLTRDDLRKIVARGLEQTRGSYRSLVQLFNVDASDYKRFLNFLRKYDCHMPFQPFRAAPVNMSLRSRMPMMPRGTKEPLAS